VSRYPSPTLSALGSLRHVLGADSELGQPVGDEDDVGARGSAVMSGTFSGSIASSCC
jgi:hypothetical protein